MNQHDDERFARLVRAALAAMIAFPQAIPWLFLQC
jgi:hypothetical protein